MKAETKFTPGPWKTGDCDSFIVWAAGFRSTRWTECEVGPEAVCIGNVSAPGWATVTPPEEAEDLDFERRERWIEECEANARLFGQAPALYGAADDLLELIADLEDAGVKLSAEQLARVRACEKVLDAARDAKPKGETA